VLRVQVPKAVAVLGKKGKFVGYFDEGIDKSPKAIKGMLEFLTRVSMGEETMHKLPPSIAPPAA
jgi:hypothetical protein